MPDSLKPYGLQHAVLPVPHCLPEFAQVHVHRIGNAIQFLTFGILPPKKWYKRTYLQNRNRLTNLEDEFIVAKKEEWGEGIVREFGIDMYIVL